MDYQRPDPDDLVRPVKPLKNASYRRLPAALPFAIAGLLVVTSVAFGAKAYTTITGASHPNATPVVIGDEPDPTVATPTEEVAPPTEAPTPVQMTLTAALSGTKVVLTWSAYQGDDFAYYKVVRSTDETVSWPLGENDTLIAAICDQSQLTLTDAAPAGATFWYQVFAVKSSEEGWVVIGSTNVVTITTPKPTPKPTQNCTMSLSASLVSAEALPNVVASGGTGVKLTWTKYRCNYFEWYVVGKSTTTTPDFPLPHEGTQGMEVSNDVNTTTWTDFNVVSGQTYYYRVMAWNSSVFCNGGTVLAKTNVVKVVIP
jgi:hypothetical protein